MEYQTLILNATYEIIRIVDWKKAVLLIFNNKVDIIEEYEQNIKTPSIKMKIPSIVKFKKVVKLKYFMPKFSKIHIYARDNLTCLYCSRKLSRKELTIDHIIPRSQNGNSTWTNCATCCVSCNIKKGDRTPVEAKMKLTYEPYQPNNKEILRLVMHLKEIKVPDTWKNYSLFR